MHTSSLLLGLLLCSSFLGLARCQLKYENHISVLDRLAVQAESQDQMAEILLKNLKLVNKEEFFSVLDGDLELQNHDSNTGGSDLGLQNHRGDSDLGLQNHRGDSDLRFQSETPRLGSSDVTLGAQCLADMFAYIDHVKPLNASRSLPWALRMADATGKPGSGLLSGSFTFLGDFDECRAVTAKYKSTLGTPKAREFKAQYCLGSYGIHFPNVPFKGFNYMWGVCVPESCSENETLQVANLALRRYNVTQVTFDAMTCNMRHVPWTPGAIGMFTLLGVITFLVAVGTVFDTVLIRLPKRRKSKDSDRESGESINGDSGPKNAVNPSVAESWRTPSDTDRLVVNNNAPTVPATSQPSRQSLIVRMFLAFSALTNTEKLLSLNQPPGALTCLNGIRVLSMNWVMLCHTCLILFLGANNVGAYIPEAVSRWSFQMIVNGTLSVDSFFLLSGLLVAYAALGHMKKSRGQMNWLHFYVHRYLRLTPVYMITLGIYVACLPYLFDGPLMPQRDGFEHNHHCRDNWWGNLLYIQNLVKFKPSYCGGWTWYLAVDMQFYVISPILLIPLYHRPKLGYIVAALLFISTSVTPFVLSETRKYPARRAHLSGNPKMLGDPTYDLYMAPYSRLGPYLVGVLTGFALYRTNGRPVKMHWVLVSAGWIASGLVGFFTVYGLKDYFNGTAMNIHLAAFYNALSRTAWGAALSWLIYCCHKGYGGPVNSFLSWKIWVPLSRLTYVVYLTHQWLLLLFGATSRTPLYLSDWTVVRMYLTTMMASYSLSIVISVLFEAPGIALEKVLLAKKK